MDWARTDGVEGTWAVNLVLLQGTAHSELRVDKMVTTLVTTICPFWAKAVSRLVQ